MTTVEKKPRVRNPVLELLGSSFKVIQDCLPLAIGTHKVIKERMPELDGKQLRSALKNHTASTRYLKALLQGDKRFDLDGNPSGEITEEQRQQASEALRERFKKKAEQHKAEQLAAKQAQQHQEKLAQLAQKFSSR